MHLRLWRLILVVSAALLALLGATNVVVAQSYPTLGQLTYEDGEGSMAYDCALQGDTLHCNFTQIRISHSTPLSPEDVEKGIAELVAAASDICGADFYSALQNARDGGAIDGVRTDAQRADAMNLYDLYETFCINPIEQTARAVAEEGNARTAATCKVGTYPFVLDFTWNNTTQRWETVSQPNGACGVVTAAFMEIDKDPDTVKYNFWTYGQQTLVTNPSGSDPLYGECKDRPNEEMSYTWKSPTAFMQCRYIQFSLF